MQCRIVGNQGCTRTGQGVGGGWGIVRVGFVAFWWLLVRVLDGGWWVVASKGGWLLVRMVGGCLSG